MAATLQRLEDVDEGARPRGLAVEGGSNGGVAMSKNESALASPPPPPPPPSCLGTSATPAVAGTGVLYFLTSIGFGLTERSRLRKSPFKQ